MPIPLKSFIPEALIMIRQTHDTAVSFSALHERFSQQLSIAFTEVSKHIERALLSAPTSKMPVRPHLFGALEVEVERFLSSLEDKDMLCNAEAHWRRWQQRATA